MTNSTGTPSYRTITNVQVLARLDTPKLFDASGDAPSGSPIDRFLANTDVINLIYLNANPVTKELGALILLGYMSAVESFLRTLVRGVINVDELARRLAEPMDLSYAAALHHSRELLPEAIIENISLAGRKGVEDVLKKIIGIKNFPNDVEAVLTEFQKVCELRHCCVHRFGKLGAKNAMKLGLATHTPYLEREFSPSKADLQAISDTLRTFVKTINNFVFYFLLDRTAKPNSDYSWSWYWNFGKDRKTFKTYYVLFASEADSPPSPLPKDVYDSFRAAR